MANAETLALAQDIRRALAGKALTERQAKLYSQRLRRDMGREGLASFTPADIDTHLDDAVLLLDCALIERRADANTPWRDGAKRAAEILEWLSQSSLKPPGAPLHLLAAAAYQIADYPAMALGHLRQVPAGEPVSALLRELLRANFPAALEALRSFWRDHRATEVDDRADPEELTTVTFRHIAMCIGTVCAYFRTGDNGMTERALAKLEHLAAGLLHSRDPFSFLLARLTAVTCRRFVESCLWPQIDRLKQVSSANAGAALTQFAKAAFSNRRALVWPAQAAGIERLCTNASFVLCTPTGSGKTTVATLAVIQGLFSDLPNERGPAALNMGNLVLYLVPSRALAAEVEARLAEDLNGIAADPVVVTGLYGGIDWGPTDAWIQTDRPTIVICTFEKADALLRFLGVLFLGRVRLVVVDEAHTVEEDTNRAAALEDGSSRAFRLEQLGARLLRARDEYGFRVLALSAVAARAAPALARWITGTADATATTSSYRSTRQMLGRVEVDAAGEYAIRYDLMDGRPLRFSDERRPDTPFVPRPFPPCPGRIGADDGPEVGVRGPTLWAALQLAAERADGAKPSVLISLTQNIEVFSAACAKLLEEWPQDQLPKFSDIAEEDELWTRCLASAADYFTAESVEYRLLRRGIAVHHGKMPGLLARRLKILIDRGYVRVVIATSTLTEGVNIPVNFLLIPSVCRGQQRLGLQEFTNLIGRAGRPGVATEGSALVVLPERTQIRDQRGRLRPKPSRQWDGYQNLITQIEAAAGAAGEGAPQDQASSSLAHLLRELEAAWARIAHGGAQDFMDWLERTAVLGLGVAVEPAFKYLDSLDGFLIAAIHEVEEMHQRELTPDQIEAELTAIWRRTYAFAAAREENRLSRIWLGRGKAIRTQYPGMAYRRRIYRTSLSPRSATSLLDIAEEIRDKLRQGVGYARWEPEEARFSFIREVLELLSQVPSFRIAERLGRGTNSKEWAVVLRWWLAKRTLEIQPAPGQITKWYEFVSQNFIYRGAWGLGSIIGLLLDNMEGGRPIRALEIDDWPRSGLPWIAFWLKELISWGTLDPVAAFLLARGDAVDRPRAEADARAYYDGLPAGTAANDMLDPRRIRRWISGRTHVGEPAPNREITIAATLARPREDYLRRQITVAPLDTNDELAWIDPAGYTVAHSQKPAEWPARPNTFEFELSVADSVIVGRAYLPHAA